MPLAGAPLAWIAQNLSCGYYLLFFSPIVVAVHRLGDDDAAAVARRRAVVAALVAACAAVAAVTLLFLLPYLELRHLGFSPRSLDETTRFSADVFAYLTADPNLRLWGSTLQAWPQAGRRAVSRASRSSLLAAFVARCLARRDTTPGGRPPWQRCSAGGDRGARWRVSLLFGWSIRLPVLRITSFSRA